MKTGLYELRGEVPKYDYIPIDDVVTTGSSLLEAIALIGTEPMKTIVVLDKRPENINPQVISIFKLPYLGS